ncbi:MAG TPA: hypothetical protein VL221_13365, partial [Bacteroidota bacterium]|nr:hypothetical protein [Bacteroidota bacterium]
MRRATHWLWPILLVTLATGLVFAQGQDLPSISSFEGALPAYWTIGNQPAGATLTWATDQSHSMGHSLKITKSTTSDTAAWISTNMCDIWSPNVPKNVDILLGAYVMTSGVNTNPATNDAKWYVAYDFYDTLGAFIGETKLPVNQTVATSTGWVADTNIAGQTVLPKAAFKVIVKFVGGKNATGTVWADDFVFYGRAGQWAGQDWNTAVGVPTGWYYWLPPNGGNDGLIANGFENTVVTTAAAHTGTHSLYFNMPPGRAVHDGFVGTQRFTFTGGTWGTGSAMGTSSSASPEMASHPFSVNAAPGDWVRISVWIKASGLFPDSAALYPGTWAVGFTPLFFAQAGNNAGYNPVGPQVDYTFQFPSVTSFDWTQYTLDVQLPTGVSAQFMEVRLHVYNQFVGQIYFDDLDVQKLDMPQAAAIGGFEGTLPAYWTMGNQPAGATLTWATDQFRSMGHSLKITKTATSDTASWISKNMCDIWSPNVPKNVDILLGAFVKTSGVNTNPATNDAKWYVAYDFYDTAGVFIGETKLPLNQTVATSTGWVADTNIAGQTVLPKTAYSLIVKFVGGKNATGTVWADDFVFYGRAGQWAGQDWNTSVGVPTGWYYWLPPNGGNDGLIANGFENTVITSEASHTGLYSLKFNLPPGRAVHDGFVGTQRIAFGNLGAGASVQAGDWVRISVWIKASGLYPDSAKVYPGTWAVGFTPLFFAQAGNNVGYNPVGPQTDYTFQFPSVTSFDWTQYTLDVQLPTAVNAQYLETRLHVYNQFVGTIYFDDLSVTKIDMPQVAAVGGFEGTLPAYWTMGNQPAGATLTWATDQFRSMGHSLKITKAATSDTAAWISGNMCDIWSQNVPKNVDILLGAYVMTSGVNTNPATNDAKWYVAYDFYDTLGAFIGETKLP